MTDMVRRLVAASAAFLCGLCCMSTPILAYADSIDDYDFAEDFLNDYKSQGTDEDGNVILSEDDYEAYMNDVFAYIEKNSSDVSDSETLTKSQTRALTVSAPVKASSGSDLVLDEVKEKSRFLDLPIFDNFVVDAIKWMITECLSNPIHAGEVLPDESETETESETQAETNPPTTTTDTVPGIAGLGSNLQKYTINGNELYERIDVAMSAKIANTTNWDDYDVKITVTRSGLGASSSSDMEYEPDRQIRAPQVYWRSGSYTSETLGFPAGTMYAGYGVSVYSMKYTLLNGNESRGGANPKFYNFSVNQLPVITRSGSTVVQLSSIMTGDNVAIFAENSFYSNDPTYVSNHTINASTNNYWNSYNVSTTNTNSYITSSTTINTTNYNDYSQYGYYVDNSGSLAIDEATLNAYIQNTLLATLLQGYIDFYTNFPEVGVSVTDEDITYVNPFDDGEEDPTETGTPSIVIDYDEILSEGELESILTQETYDIPELDTSFSLETFFIDYEGIQPETTAAPLPEMRKRVNSRTVTPEIQEAQMYTQLRSDIQTKGGDLVDDVQSGITDFIYSWFLGTTVDTGDGPVEVNPISNEVIEYNPVYRVIMCTAIFSAIYKALKR